VVDTCTRESVVAWAKRLREERPTMLFRAASAFLPSADEGVGMGVNGKRKGEKDGEREDDGVGVEGVLECLGRWAEGKEGEALVVAVVGVTNVSASFPWRR
jgi:nuclear GTP-binding protein